MNMTSTLCISRRSLRPQQGGTFLGFVLGLLVGLGVALAVAMYVMKVPVPFVDKGISRKPADDIQEAERNKHWNPNAGFIGKAAKELQEKNKTAVNAASSAPADPVATAEPAKTKPSKAESAASDPLGDLAQYKLQAKADAKRERDAKSDAAGTEPEKAPAKNAVDGNTFKYFVQAGSYRSAEDAQSQRAKLTLMGLDAQISEREQAGRQVYRVRLGPFDQQGDAENAKENLQGNGLESALVRVQR
jgi:cell division protein FtsN